MTVKLRVNTEGMGLSANGERRCMRCSGPLVYRPKSNTHYCTHCAYEFSFPEFRKRGKEAIDSVKDELSLFELAPHIAARKASELESSSSLYKKRIILVKR